MEMAGVPKAVHSAFILVSPVYAKPNGAGPVAAGVRITGVASHFRHSFRAFCDEPSGLVVLHDRDLEAFLNQVRKIGKLRAVVLEPLLVETGALLEHYRGGCFGELGQHAGNIDKSDEHAVFLKHGQSILKR